MTQLAFRSAALVLLAGLSSATLSALLCRYASVPSTLAPLITAAATLVACAWAAGALAQRVATRLDDVQRRLRDWREGSRQPLIDGEDEWLSGLGSAVAKLGQTLDGTVATLRTTQAQSAIILDSMQEGILLLDQDTRVLYTNPSLREQLLARSDLIGKPLIEVVRNAELVGVVEMAARGIDCRPIEFDSGGLRPRRLLARAVSLAEARGVVIVFVDVTDVRKLERIRREFVANVSHELRTPITALVSSAETLRLALGREDETALRFIDIIERNAARLRALVEDLLDLSRIEASELQLRPERLRLPELIAQSLRLFQERAAAKRIRLVCVLAAADSTQANEIFGDRRVVEQILANLIDNAIKYGAVGGLVQVIASRTQTGMKLTVADDGPGIPERHHARIFERFYRLDSGRGRDQGGTGLGLAIVKHLAEAHGGGAEVRSAQPRGTTFEIQLADLPPHLADARAARAGQKVE